VKNPEKTPGFLSNLTPPFALVSDRRFAMQKDKSSQGIVLDEKSQEQPNDKERARTGSYAAAAGKEGRRASAFEGEERVLGLR
jgi:hypothetical protein